MVLISHPPWTWHGGRGLAGSPAHGVLEGCVLWVHSLCFCPAGKSVTLFSNHTKAIVWGMQTRAVQGMLDFDYVCSREEPSVAAMVYPFT